MASLCSVVTLITLLLAFATACDDNSWWTCPDTFVVGRCLYAKFNAVVQITYATGSNGTVEIHVPQPTDSGVNLTSADSSCFMHSNESVLAIDWMGSSKVGLNCSLQLKFLNQTSFWYLYGISVHCSSNDFSVDAEVNKVDKQPGLFQQLYPNSYYYYCDSDVTFEVNASNVKVEMWNARIFPFSKPGDARKWLCYPDAEKEGRLVPIIVGAIIGFLMIVIFLAYIAAFSRRKCAERRAQKSYVPLGNDM